MMNLTNMKQFTIGYVEAVVIDGKHLNREVKIGMKKKKKKRIGEMTNSRIQWERKPQTQIVPNKKGYTRKNKHKIENTE